MYNNKNRHTHKTLLLISTDDDVLEDVWIVGYKVT